MGTPLPWHRRQAMMLASQLPEDIADARLVVQAVMELLETFLADESTQQPTRPANVLPFTAG